MNLNFSLYCLLPVGCNVDLCVSNPLILPFITSVYLQIISVTVLGGFILIILVTVIATGFFEGNLAEASRKRKTSPFSEIDTASKRNVQ